MNCRFAVRGVSSPIDKSPRFLNNLVWWNRRSASRRIVFLHSHKYWKRRPLCAVIMCVAVFSICSARPSLAQNTHTRARGITREVHAHRVLAPVTSFSPRAAPMRFSSSWVMTPQDFCRRFSLPPADSRRSPGIRSTCIFLNIFHREFLCLRRRAPFEFQFHHHLQLQSILTAFSADSSWAARFIHNCWLVKKKMWLVALQISFFDRKCAQN